jgi:hypothetical protein
MYIIYAQLIFMYKYAQLIKKYPTFYKIKIYNTAFKRDIFIISYNSLHIARRTPASEEYYQSRLGEGSGLEYT